MTRIRAAHSPRNALRFAGTAILLAAALVAAVLIPGQILAAHRAAAARGADADAAAPSLIQAPATL